MKSIKIILSILFVGILYISIQQKALLASCPDNSWTELVDPIDISVLVNANGLHYCEAWAYLCEREVNGTVEFYISSLKFLDGPCITGVTMTDDIWNQIYKQILDTYFNSNNLPTCDDQKYVEYVKIKKAPCWKYHTNISTGEVTYLGCSPDGSDVSCIVKYQVCWDTSCWCVKEIKIPQTSILTDILCNTDPFVYMPGIHEDECYLICE